MKVFYIAAECKPFSKVGGVGDVAGELPPALKAAGVDIEIVTPLYGDIHLEQTVELVHQFALKFHGNIETVGIYRGTLEDVPVYFIQNSTYFEGAYASPYINSREIAYYDDIRRFSFFSEACLYLIKQKNPDIVHANDWPLGYLFARMQMAQLTARRVLTIHNIGYQGNIGKVSIKGWFIEKILQDEKLGPLFTDPRTEWHSVNALKLALELAHRVNTVSPTYCREITEPEDSGRYFDGGKGLHEVTKRLHDQRKLIGILNGFHYPEKRTFKDMIRAKAEMKKEVAEHFANPNGFLIGFVGRAVAQKFKLLTEKLDGKSVLEHIVDGFPEANIAVLATGLPEYETFLKRLAETKPSNLWITIAFDKLKAYQISLGSDLFLMPSLFEPCGITQMASMSYATPPLVRWTGGLVDTVQPHTSKDGTGFGFDGNSRREVLSSLIASVREALALYASDPKRYLQIQRNAFSRRFYWSTFAKQYVEEVYEPALRDHQHD